MRWPTEPAKQTTAVLLGGPADLAKMVVPGAPLTIEVPAFGGMAVSDQYVNFKTHRYVRSGAPLRSGVVVYEWEDR